MKSTEMKASQQLSVSYDNDDLYTNHLDFEMDSEQLKMIQKT